MSSHIRARCRCGRRFNVSESALGKTGHCPSCKAVFRLIAPRFTPEHDRFDATLVLEAGPTHAGEQLIVGGPGPIEIGKLPGRDIELTGQRVSRRHCRLVRIRDRWRIEDLRSTNGLFVNTNRVESQELSDGDRIEIGEYTLRYVRADESASASEALPALAEGIPQPAEDLLGNILRALTEGEVTQVQAPPPLQPAGSSPLPAGDAATGDPSDGSQCPSCRGPVDRYAWFCPACGTQLRTATADAERPVVEPGPSPASASVEPILGWICWLLPLGFFPAASERTGRHRAYVVSALAILTLIASAWFWKHSWASSPDMRTLKNYFLWSGGRQPDPTRLCTYYTTRGYGDNEAFQAKLEEVGTQSQGSESGRTSMMDLVLAAHKALPPEQQATGQYRRSQLITYAFVHADVAQLVLNLLVLLYIGSRVNALIGNVATLVLYPLLAVLGGAFHAAMTTDAACHPTVGASAAVMGLLGMYLVLMPRQRMPMMFCYRMGRSPGFAMRMKPVAVPAFLMAAPLLVADLIYTLVKLEGNVGHWAQPGSFAVGSILGLVLVKARLVDPRGGIRSAIIPATADNGPSHQSPPSF